jgi:hypothetical protein
MSTSKMYTVAGTSSNNGKTKVRFANDYVARFKILTKNGHDNVNIMELDTPMSKGDVCKYLQSHDKFQDEASQSAIAEFVVRNVKAGEPVSTPEPITAEPVIKVEVDVEEPSVA